MGDISSMGLQDATRNGTIYDTGNSLFGILGTVLMWVAPVILVLTVLYIIFTFKKYHIKKKKEEHKQTVEEQTLAEKQKLVKENSEKYKIKEKTITDREFISDEKLIQKLGNVDDPVDKMDYAFLDLEFDKNGKVMK